MNTQALRIKLAALAALALAAAGLSAQEMTGEGILAAVDKNAKFDTVRYVARLEVSKGKRKSVKVMKAEATGDDKALIEFTNPEDLGIKYLKSGGELWAYFPEENDKVKISGHQLKEGLMGSDVSYEDALDPDELSGKYEVALRGTEELDGRKAYVVDLKATAKDVPYDLRSQWVDAERFVILKEEMKSKGGTLIKTSRALEVRQAQGRWYVSAMEMRDMRKKDSLTVFRVDSITYDVKIDAKKFWLDNLVK